ncbi:hypothetical protein [Hyalangium gracile]|uniref:hypothetical protein n=1 Tax=Hyalangium gracile TaxID=394092 RepID=UPI001CCE5ADC|nr:hypothetical protein [Hyalangium gracile]
MLANVRSEEAGPVKELTMSCKFRRMKDGGLPPTGTCACRLIETADAGQTPMDAGRVAEPTE